MFTFDINPADADSVRRALSTEWLLTNGLGGYAMGTALGVNTRRYHGLLVAASKPPVGRIVLLHSMIEQMVMHRDDGAVEVIDLSTQQFGRELTLHPQGWRYLRRFTVGSHWATWEFQAAAIRFRRTIHAEHNAQRITISYDVISPDVRWTLRVRPLFLARDFHGLGSDSRVSTAAGELSFQINSLLALDLSHTARRWVDDPQTWDNFAYVCDRDRGQEWIEHGVCSPYYWEFDSRSSAPMSIVMSVAAWGVPAARGPSTTTEVISTSSGQMINGALRAAAAQFIVRRCHGEESQISVIAGYPWFADWGRDTMISLPGLMLCTGRVEDARMTLLTFARHRRNGLIPNVFDDSGEGAQYNSADASLWFVHAVHELRGLKRAVDPELLGACRDIIAAYRKGTDFNIFMDEDGLIVAGDEGSQLTWMDAKRDGVVFTPRHGKAVEINALWFNALQCLAEMSDDENERQTLAALTHKVADSFREQFWGNDGGGFLHDVLLPAREAATGDVRFRPDGKRRPNQIFAVSLPHSPLNPDQQRAVVKTVGDRLLTPFGLRTLDPHDPNYRGRYEGNMFQRDAAYHNGTVWPWLIGPYCEALLRVNQFDDDTKRQVKRIVQPLIDEMGSFRGGRCIGQIAEVYDGDPPHRPGGCPAQAWSVAEVLRILTVVDCPRVWRAAWPADGAACLRDRAMS
jgi:predicted glycogen debranching enzyme